MLYFSFSISYRVLCDIYCWKTAMDRFSIDSLLFYYFYFKRWDRKHEHFDRVLLNMANNIARNYSLSRFRYVPENPDFLPSFTCIRPFNSHNNLNDEANPPIHHLPLPHNQRFRRNFLDHLLGFRNFQDRRFGRDCDADAVRCGAGEQR